MRVAVVVLVVKSYHFIEDPRVHNDVRGHHFISDSDEVMLLKGVSSLSVLNADWV